jgi:predicted aconitase
MQLTRQEQDMLAGKYGRSTRKAMEILTALGTIYGAEQMVPVSSVQISGVSYDNLDEAGLSFLAEMAEGGGRAQVLTTLNPAGMDIENWQALGISENFAHNQMRVIEAFEHMGVITTCTCTPYLSGNLPHFGEHIAWAESSAVAFANSVIGARTNREGGPGALAAALTGRTPEYGFHLDLNRNPTLTVKVNAAVEDTRDFGALGIVIGKLMETCPAKPVPFLTGIQQASIENLKSFCASLATYGGAAIFHMQGITAESGLYHPPTEEIRISREEIDRAIESLNDASSSEIDFVSLGCPHLTIKEISHLADLLAGKKVNKEFWITTSRPTKQISDQMGFTRLIEESGALFAVDTCCVVSPIRARFKALATDSAKACYYAFSKNKFKTMFKPFDEVVAEALK